MFYNEVSLQPPPRDVLVLTDSAEKLAHLIAEVPNADGSSTWPVAHTIDHLLIYCAWNGDETAWANFLAHVRRDAQVACLVPTHSLSAWLSLLADVRCNHVFCEGYQPLEDLLRVTTHKWRTRDVFGLEKYLPLGTVVHTSELRNFGEREQALRHALRFAKEHGIRRHLRSAMGQVCEELLMNALYDAPVNDAGTAIFANVPTQHRTQLSSPKSVTLQYAVSEKCLGVAVKDQYGRLTKTGVLDSLLKCLSRDPQIDEKALGAGLGLYFVVRNTAGCVINVEPGVTTEVICLWDRRSKQPLQFLSFFETSH